MLLKIDRDLLKNAVSQVKKALPKVIIQEERGHLLFSVEGGKVKITGTNSDLKASYELPVEVDTEDAFAFTLNTPLLEKLLAKIECEKVRIDFDATENLVKIYTTETGKSFSSFQSFPPDKMLSFSFDSAAITKSYKLKKAILTYTLNFSNNYLAPVKEEQKQYDFVVIDKGIVYSANGSNKMGFIVFSAYKTIEGLKIRKAALPFLLSFLESEKQDEVTLFETAKDIGITFEGSSAYFSFLKSNTEAPTIKTDYVKSEGPYTKIDKNKLLKVLNRLMVTNPSSTNTGIEVILQGSGAGASLQLSLLSNLKAVEEFPCERVNDPSEESVTHTIDYKILKAILSSFETDKEVRLHINDEARFFKVYNGGEVAENKYLLAGIGSYSKAVRQ